MSSKVSYTIKVLSGSAYLSSFRLAKLQQYLPQVCYAEYVHLLQVDGELDDDEVGRVETLLHYGPEQGLPKPCGDRFVTVVPRQGTITPWSSKASDIFSICGISKVHRVERGVRWFSQGRVDESNWQHLHDRMIEACVIDEDFASIFARQEPRPLKTITLLETGEDALYAANTELGLALSPDEIEYLAGAYRDLARNPTDVELMMFAQANSEHCRHKIFNADWLVDGQPQARSLFGKIRNTHEQINGRGVLSAYSDNAAVIAGEVDKRLWVDPESHEYQYVTEPVHVLMKVETHNHPTAIAPFPGAATGSGGEIRDEGAVGRGSKPKAGLTGFTTSHLNIPGLEQPWELHTDKPEHTSSALDIMLEGPIGGASFNNEYGRPAINGYFRTMEIEHQNKLRGYHKPIMVAGGLGTVRAEHVHQQDFAPGTALVVLGGPAMLIGLGGGAASSMAAGTSHSELDFASVQRGNPEMERRCQEVIDSCCALGDANPIRLIHDVGAGGLSNALPELVNDSGTGGDFRLRDIPNADPSMAPVEIWCNEAQERYVLGIGVDGLQAFEKICARERCPYAVVGRSNEDQQLRVEDHLFENSPVDIPMDVLFGKAPKMQRSFQRVDIPTSQLDLTGVTLTDAIERVLQFPAVASKQFLITIGDRSITGMVACQPMIGPWQTPVADAAVTIRGYDSYHGEAMAMGERTPMALIDPAAAAKMAVAEALTNIVSADVTSVDRVVLSANWMAAAGDNIEEQSLFDAVTAVGEDLCPALGIAIPVGKDSLSMQTRWQHDDGKSCAVTSPVSLIVTSFAPVGDVRLTRTPQLQVGTEAELILLHFGQQRLGGSVLAQVYRQMGVDAPDVDSPSELRALLDFLLEQKRHGLIIAQHDRSDGGLLATLLEMAFAARCGLEIELPGNVDPLSALFNEEIGVVVQVARAEVGEFVNQCPTAHMIVGRAVATEDIVIRHEDKVVYQSDRRTLQRCWAKTSYAMQSLRDNEQCANEEYESIDATRSSDGGLSAKLSFDPSENVAAAYVNVGVKPRIAVLREQGVNGQVEMAAAFERAGFNAVDVHMSDLLGGSKQLDQYQVMVACGGFSYGDVLGGGGGWAKSVMFHDAVRQQFEDFFRQGLTLGICNGCQMLAQLSELIPAAQQWPVFVRNQSEQFEGRTVLVRINTNSSPWLQGMQGSVLPVAVAHGEGRAEFRGQRQFDTLQASGQVALQYVDSNYQTTESYPANPNGAMQGLAGITAADGRILAMMPHPERVFRSCQNVWQAPAWDEDGPWLRLFRNARVVLD